LNRLQLNMKEAMDIVRDRQEWRHRISTSSSPLGWRASKKKKKKKKKKAYTVYLYARFSGFQLTFNSVYNSVNHFLLALSV